MRPNDQTLIPGARLTPQAAIDDETLETQLELERALRWQAEHAHEATLFSSELEDRAA